MTETQRPSLDSGATAPAGRDRWAGFRTLIWVRLLTAALVLPFGLLLRPDPSLAAWGELGWSLLAVGMASGFLWLATLWRRAANLQLAVHILLDATAVSLIAARGGGQQSQFVLLFVLAVIAGGIHGRMWGGLGSAAACTFGFLALPGLVRMTGGTPVAWVPAVLPTPLLLIALLLVVGGLAGVLGLRADRAVARLEHASRELTRLRLDNDAILRHLTSGVITLDGTGTVAYLNPAAEEILRVRFGQVQGRWVQDALTERLKPLRDALMSCLERHEALSRGEVLTHTESGDALPLGLSTNLLTHDGTVTGVVAVFTDLSEVREMERRARRNETLAEVGALAAGIAHELRNGINPISGSVECLQRELRLEGENAQLMELITKECARLNRFVTDLLNYSREREPVRMALELNDNLAELCEIVSRDPRCGNRTTVSFEPRPESATVQADREQLRQVWLNLASNALEAMAQGGRLTIRWVPEDDERVRVEFEDEGGGIASGDLARVGQPFFTTKRGGTGLGLAIAQRIVERHGGQLRLESAPGRGTVARVTLPGTVQQLAQVA